MVATSSSISDSRSAVLPTADPRGHQVAFAILVAAIYIVAAHLTPHLRPSFQIASAVVLLLTPSLVTRAPVAHPVHCCLPFLLLHTISYPLATYFGGTFDEFIAATIRVKLIFAGGLLLGFFALVGPRRLPSRPTFAFSGELKTAALILMLACQAAGLAGLIYAGRSGAVSKRDFIDNYQSAPVAIMNFALTAVPIFCIAYELLRAKSLNRPARLVSWPICSSAFVMLVGYALIGERDVLFRFCLFLALLLFDGRWFYRRIYAIVLILTLLIAAPASQYFKAVLISSGDPRGANVGDDYRDGSKFFMQEFAASSRNLSLLKLYDQRIGVGQVAQDVGRSFYVPGTRSASAWFHHVFRPRFNLEGTSGWGFTLCGEIVTIFGIVGLVVFGALYGGWISWLYDRRSDSLWFYLLFISNVYAFTYSQRGDLTTLLAFTLKVPLFQMAMLWATAGMLKVRVASPRRRAVGISS